MRRLFGLPVAARPAALRAMYGADGGATWGPGTMMVMAHESGDAFRVGVDDPRYTAALDRLVDADAWGQIERRLHEAWAYQRSHAPQAEHPESIDVWLALGNPDDPLFLEGTLGYYGMGSMPGCIWLVAWPTDYNVSRIGACAVHEFGHQLRGSNVPWRPTVGEWVVSEGLAEEFALAVCGPGATGGWYARIEGETFERAWRTVTAGLDLEGLDVASAYVMGDAIATRMGRPAIGLPHMAGYAVGRRLVQTYLEASGDSPGAALLRATKAIVAASNLRTE